MPSSESPIISSMTNSLAQREELPFRQPAWLDDGHRDPRAFWDRYLQPLIQFTGGRSRSRLNEGYDLYHDLITRHVGNDETALVWHDPQRGLKEVSFDTLHNRCRCLGEKWRSQGAENGQSIVIALPFGYDYLTAVLTGLRLGMIITPVPPLGRTFVKERLEAAAPDWLVTTESFARWMKSDTPRLPEEAPSISLAGSADRSHYYEANDIAARFFSPLRQALLEPVELSAETLYFGLARDGVFCLGLSRGDQLAAPGFCPAQFQPTLALTTFFAGASFLDVSPEAIDLEPSLVQGGNLTHLGVIDRVRDILLSEESKTLGGFKRWFRNAAERIEWGRWDQFSKRAAQNGQLGFSYYANAAAAGCIFTGVARRRPRYMHVLPVPAEAFSLADTNLSGMPAVGQSGIFEWQDLDNAEAALGRLLVSQDRSEYMLLGAFDHNRDGQIFPATAVTALANRQPGVTDACMVMHPGAGSDWRAILIVFVPPSSRVEADAPALITQLRTACGVELGPRAIPDKIEVFGLMPRYQDDLLSERWCREQYLSGMLHRKSETKCFVDLAALRYAAEALRRSQSGGAQVGESN